MTTALVICNGPSLNDIPIEFLDKYPTFGSNRIYLRYVPDIYACVNPLVIQQYKDEINQMNCTKFIRESHKYLIPDSIGLKKGMADRFSTNALEWINEGWTVTFVLLQLAYHYNFTKIGIVGMDHRYSFSGNPNEKLTATGNDTNHFDPSYFSNGAYWNAPDLVRSEKSYELAKKAFETAGRRIVNLTKNSAYEGFEKEDWQTW